MDKAVDIKHVSGFRGRRQFIKVPGALHAHDPQWISPLYIERAQHISRKLNPYFQHADAAFWIARRNGRTVGRVSAQIDRLHQERYQDHTGFFGMLDAEDDAEVYDALLTTAENWLRERAV